QKCLCGAGWGFAHRNALENPVFFAVEKATVVLGITSLNTVAPQGGLRNQSTGFRIAQYKRPRLRSAAFIFRGAAAWLK
ncbi:MAG: hypothetical protein ACLPWS_14635, partial [Rhodomicrobium sp.]